MQFRSIHPRRKNQHDESHRSHRGHARSCEAGGARVCGSRPTPLRCCRHSSHWRRRQAGRRDRMRSRARARGLHRASSRDSGRHFRFDHLALHRGCGLARRGDAFMTITRREFLKDSALASALAAAGTAEGANIITESQFTRMTWSKAPCRFCGTGCGVKVAVKDGRVVATHADANAEGNRGINCVKGYFLSKIMYGSDRLTQPLLRMKDGKFHKDGEFTPVSWDRAFDVMAEKFKAALKEKGPN